MIHFVGILQSRGVLPLYFCSINFNQMKTKNILRAYKTFAIITYGSGILLHSSRIIFGAEYFLKHILTLNNDKIFSIPMFFAAIFSWLAIKSIDFKAKWRKIIYLIIAAYTTVSVPVHIKSWFTADLKQIEAFPQNYSYIILPVLLSMLLFTISLKQKNNN